MTNAAFAADQNTTQLYNPILHRYFPVKYVSGVCQSITPTANSTSYPSKLQGTPSILEQYKDGFSKFNNTIRLYDNVIAWTTPVTTNNTFFSTATNRSVETMEMYIVYNSTAPTLDVWDWSNDKTTHVCSIPLSAISGTYIRDRLINGKMYPVLGMVNESKQISTNYWANTAYLWNPEQKEYDVIYQHNFKLNPIVEKSKNSCPYYDLDKCGMGKSLYYTCQPNAGCGYWGPMIETGGAYKLLKHAVGFYKPLLFHDGVYSHLSNHNINFKVSNSNFKIVYHNKSNGTLIVTTRIDKNKSGYSIK